MKKIIIALLMIIIIVAIAGCFYWNWLKNRPKYENINSYEDCVALGFPVPSIYPGTCCTPNNKKCFTQDIGDELNKMDLVIVDFPRPTAVVVSPLEIKGEARGTWFFEASFPVELLDENGKVIATGIAQAKSDWMTENFVPFELKLEFQKPETKKGNLILRKDNPSGLPENDDQFRIPVRFE